MLHLFSANYLKPTGWLHRQLRIQADGLSGNLDKIWPDIRDSAWIGGDRDGWERVPYWLDGFIPLAWLLDDEDMKARAKRYVDGILDRQCADGWICPCSKEARKDYDVWAYQLVCKVLALYCDFTADKRAYDGLCRALRCLYELMSNGTVKLKDWGKFRWFEALIPIAYIYERTGEEYLLSLARLLREQGTDYTALTERWVRPLNIWTLETHVVNLNMMIKYGALVKQLLGEESVTVQDDPAYLWGILEKYNGTAVGTITGDECLAGIGNTHGFELCSIAELMYSCETLYTATGNAVWADRVEKAAFNALPAAISDDMWTHQYDQLVNQIACEKYPNKPIFRTNNGESGLFGLEPGFGCCTSNFNQAWPKFAMNAYQHDDGAIVCAHLVPCKLTTAVNGVAVTIENVSEYPFRLNASIHVSVQSQVTFPLKIRVPSWAKSAAARTDGQKALRMGDYLVIDRAWEGESVVEIILKDEPHLVKRPNGVYVAAYGPLVFALPIEAEYHMKEYTRDGVERKFPYCDYELTPKSEWRYGFASKTLEPCLGEGNEYPFSASAPRIALKASMAPVDWDFADGYDNVSAEKANSAVAQGEAREMLLVPYGAAKLRVTEMIMTRKSKG
ncbi:MAG: glycoside hydrolase family 127 protein [Clostridia bacterium]|nr:glycoside hydrolase family 127 protein [Clostridia bacterium]